MKIKQWGEVWEEKMKVQDEVGIIHGTNSSMKDILNELKKDEKLFSKWLLPLLPKKAKILDLGVGPMARHSIMFSKEGYAVTGIDISKTTLEHAKKWAKKENQKIEFIKANLVDLSKIGKKYDLVFCTQTFGHIPSYLALIALNQFKDKTKKNGYCLVQFWLEKEKSFLKLLNEFLYQVGFMIKKKFKKTFPVNCSAYTQEEIDDLIKRSGFKLISQKGNLFLLKKANQNE